MHVKIKICGITRYEDAKTATSLGVDALGFIFYAKSPRAISPQSASEIIRKLPPFVSKVGVFVNESYENICEIANVSGIGTIQLHGDESPEFCSRFSLPVIKAFSVATPQDCAAISHYHVGGFLLDTWDASLAGGSGRTFDWSIAEEVARTYPGVIIAGGLGPANIAEALAAVRPYGVDVNSGVEIKPGIKNPQKMRTVIDIVTGWK